jgi:hypothetical protein
MEIFVGVSRAAYKHKQMPVHSHPLLRRQCGIRAARLTPVLVGALPVQVLGRTPLHLQT